jgi:alcohol dehydrogenase
VEASIGPQKNPISDAFASAAITLIRENIFTVIKDGKNKDARLAMANAALMAGIAFSNSMVGVVHATAHALGGVCHVPHGIANGIMLPFGLELNMDVVAESLASLLLPLAGEDEFIATPKEVRATAAVAAVRKLTSRLSEMTHIPTRLKDAGVQEDQLEKVAQIAMNDGALAFNPKEVSFEEVLGLVKAAF